MRQLPWFACIEAQCYLFAVVFFLGLGVVRLVPLPIDEADSASTSSAFLGAAVNVATLGWPWKYPSQESVWTLVHPAKIARGSVDAEIAKALFLGEPSVKTHVTRVLAKLQLRDRVHAVVLAHECGPVRPGAG